jgi:hypothetical protein
MGFEHPGQPGTAAGRVNDEVGADRFAGAEHDAFDHGHGAAPDDQIGHARAGPDGHGRLGGQRLADDRFVEGAPGAQQGVARAVP